MEKSYPIKTPMVVRSFDVEKDPFGPQDEGQEILGAQVDLSVIGALFFYKSKSRSTAMLLTDKRRIHLRSASVWTYTFFTTGFPRFLSIRGARGLQEFDLLLLQPYLRLN
jgi:hypothetical protein